MICFLWILFPSLSSMALAGGSGSTEVVKPAGGMMTGGMAGTAAGRGILNGIVVNGQLPQLVPVGALLLQQPGGVVPVNQGGAPMLPGLAVQPGGALPLAFALSPQQQPQPQQPGFPQGQPQLPQTVLPLFAVLPQANGMMEMGGLQFPMVAAGQQVQILPLGGAGNLQQGAGGGQGQGPAAKARVKHSVKATQEPLPTDSGPKTVIQNPTIRPMPLIERLKKKTA